MPQLAVTRKGWENEHLATFLLSRVSFVAHPITISDDVGSDFFCTLFETQQRNGTELLFPVSSLAIQVKSSAERIQATNKIDYLINLELPFFVGVVDPRTHRLAIYSGEYLPIVFSHLGRPTELSLKPCDVSELESHGPYDGRPEGPCTLRMPLITHLESADAPSVSAQKGKDLAVLCSRMHANIAARKHHEYIFRLGSGQVQIMAGPGSVQTFRLNFALRLAEAFYNLEWLLDKRAGEFSIVEFCIYEQLLDDLLRTGTPMPAVVADQYQKLRRKVDERVRPSV